MKILQDVDMERAILGELERPEGGGSITLGFSSDDLEGQSGEDAPCDESAKHRSCALEKEWPVCSWTAGHWMQFRRRAWRQAPGIYTPCRSVGFMAVGSAGRIIPNDDEAIEDPARKHVSASSQCFIDGQDPPILACGLLEVLLLARFRLSTNSYRARSS